jgi:hypothetical protein
MRVAILLPVGSSILATVVEESIVIVGMLQWENCRVDEGVDGQKVGFQVLWQIEIHIGSEETGSQCCMMLCTNSFDF